jgi:hypothetical protein
MAIIPAILVVVPEDNGFVLSRRPTGVEHTTWWHKTKIVTSVLPTTMALISILQAGRNFFASCCVSDGRFAGWTTVCTDADVRLWQCFCLLLCGASWLANHSPVSIVLTVLVAIPQDDGFVLPRGPTSVKHASRWHETEIVASVLPSSGALIAILEGRRCRFTSCSVGDGTGASGARVLSIGNDVIRRRWCCLLLLLLSGASWLADHSTISIILTVLVAIPQDNGFVLP